MRTLTENYLHFLKKCIRPPYKKLKSLKLGFIENPNIENNRDPWEGVNKGCLALRKVGFVKNSTNICFYLQFEECRMQNAEANICYCNPDHDWIKV